MREFFLMVLAGLAGSPRMVAASICCLGRLVYKFHGIGPPPPPPLPPPSIISPFSFSLAHRPGWDGAGEAAALQCLCVLHCQVKRSC